MFRGQRPVVIMPINPDPTDGYIPAHYPVREIHIGLAAKTWTDTVNYDADSGAGTTFASPTTANSSEKHTGDSADPAPAFAPLPKYIRRHFADNSNSDKHAVNYAENFHDGSSRTLDCFHSHL